MQWARRSSSYEGICCRSPGNAWTCCGSVSLSKWVRNHNLGATLPGFAQRSFGGGDSHFRMHMGGQRLGKDQTEMPGCQFVVCGKQPVSFAFGETPGR